MIIIYNWWLHYETIPSSSYEIIWGKNKLYQRLTFNHGSLVSQQWPRNTVKFRVPWKSELKSTAVIQPSWQTLLAQGCSATVTKSGAPIPPGQKVSMKMMVFLMNVKKRICRKLNCTEPMRQKWVELIVDCISFCICNLFFFFKQRTADNYSPSNTDMKALCVSAAPIPCRSHGQQLKYTVTLWHGRYIVKMQSGEWPSQLCSVWCRRNMTSFLIF